MPGVEYLDLPPAAPQGAGPGGCAPARHSSLFLSAITRHELELAVLLAERREPTREPCCATGSSKPWCRPLRGAALHGPNPKPFRDGLIAATALVHSLVVVTRNLADFEATGVPLLNPWQQG